MSTVVKRAAADEPRVPLLRRLRNAVARLWRGDLDLIWPLGIGALTSLLSVLLEARLYEGLVNEWPLVPALIMSIVVTIVLLSSVTLSIVGIWRAASSKVAPHRPRFAHIAARALSATALLPAYLLFSSVITALEQRRLDALSPFHAQITADGTALVLGGRLGFRSASIVRRSLDQAPQVRTLVLASGGGRNEEALDIVELVVRNKLDTAVTTECTSACTFVYLAGQRRYLAPGARLGFHSIRYDRLYYNVTEDPRQALAYLYKALGLPAPFIQRIVDTPVTRVWYPTLDELMANNVVTHLLQRHDQGPSLAVTPPRSEHGVQGGGRASATMGTNDPAALSLTPSVGADLLLHVNDDAVEAYLQLLIEQMAAARKISDETCAGFAQGKIDAAQILPAQLVQREQAWVAKASQMRAVERAHVDRARFADGLEEILNAVPFDLVAVAAQPSAYKNDPRRYCEGVTALYENVNRQPSGRRALVFRGLVENTVTWMGEAG